MRACGTRSKGMQRARQRLHTYSVVGAHMARILTLHPKLHSIWISRATCQRRHLLAGGDTLRANTLVTGMHDNSSGSLCTQKGMHDNSLWLTVHTKGGA